MSDSFRPHEPQHARLPCPSPRVHPNPYPSSRWCHPTISSSVVPFSSCPQSFPASRSFQMTQLFTSGGQSIGVSVSCLFLLCSFHLLHVFSFCFICCVWDLLFAGCRVIGPLTCRVRGGWCWTSALWRFPGVGTGACVLVGEAGSCSSNRHCHVQWCVLGYLWANYGFRQPVCHWVDPGPNVEMEAFMRILTD